MIEHLHNFVKTNYQQGTYFEAQREYEHWQANYDQIKSQEDPKQIDDYHLGYQQAEIDYRESQTFRYYPSYLINFANRISENRFVEISDFLRGYNDYKQTIVTQQKNLD